MGISPIEYRPWIGKRTGYYSRLLTISLTTARQALKSKWVLVVLILGIIIVHVFPIVFNALIPHEGLTPNTMVGDGTGRQLDYAYGMMGGKGESTDTHEINNVTITGNIYRDGPLTVNGTVVLNGSVDISGQIKGSGTINGHGVRLTTGTYSGDVVKNGTIVVVGNVTVYGALTINGWMEGEGSLGGVGSLEGNGSLTPPRVSREKEGPDEEESFASPPTEGYMNSGLFSLFTILLASLLCSGLVSEDLESNSFVLYFSRPIKVRDYLAGKALGAFMVMAIFSTLLPLIFALSVMGTQSGDDYYLSLQVLSSTFGAGLLMAFIFIPYGIMVSTFTKKKTFAGIGIFISLFVLNIVSTLFLHFDPNWALISPQNVLFLTFDLIYGYPLWDKLNPWLYGLALIIILVGPMALAHIRIQLKSEGR